MKKTILSIFLLLCIRINIINSVTLNNDSMILSKEALEEELHQLRIAENNVLINFGLIYPNTDVENKTLVAHIQKNFKNMYKPAAYPQSSVVPIAIIDDWISTISKFLTFTFLPISIPIAIVMGIKDWFGPTYEEKHLLLENKLKDIQRRKKIIEAQLDNFK